MKSGHFVNSSSCFSQQWEHTFVQKKKKNQVQKVYLGIILLNRLHMSPCFQQFSQALMAMRAYVSVHV